MTLAVFHYHLRPGGVTRVIELAVPHVAQALGAKSVRFIVGEAPAAEWLANIRAELDGVRVECRVVPVLRYCSEWTGRADISAAARAAIEGANLVWAHNLSVGRNLIAARALHEACAAKDVPLVLHHHDWWFDHRWQRWPEMRALGIRTMRDAARALFGGADVFHATINEADAAMLRGAGCRVAWLPNLFAASSLQRRREIPPGPSTARSRAWPGFAPLRMTPMWLMPSRFLRRKNIAEGLLLARLLRPEARVVVLGDASSADEVPYTRTLLAAAREHGWPLHGALADAPPMGELLAASEAVLLTSVQEGFGLAVLEAAQAGRPLLLRRLGNVTPDLESLGLRFPHAYEDIAVDAALYDSPAERERQRERFREMLAQMPASAAGQVPAMVPPRAFSQLTLAAQIEVLANPDTTRVVRELNPWLRKWRGPLRPVAGIAAAQRALCGEAYARRFCELLAQRAPRSQPHAEEIQCACLREKLRDAGSHPLLWSREA